MKIKTEIVFFLIFVLISCQKNDYNQDKKEQKLNIIEQATKTPTTLPNVDNLQGINQTIEEKEKIVIQSAFDEASTLDYKTKEDWTQASERAYEFLSVNLIPDSEMEAFIKKDLRGESPARTVDSKEVVIQREKQTGEEFATHTISEIPKLSNEELIQARLKTTLSITINETFKLNNSELKGLPVELLENNIQILAKIRNAINVELQARGVKI